MAYLPGLGRELLKAAANAPFLEREEEKQLALAWRDQGDRHALHKLTSAHMRLVIAIAAKFRHYGLPLPDLVQEGHIGLLEAAARFTPERDVRFSTYATWWIRASIQDYVLRNWSIVRGGTSSSQKALFFNLRRLRARLARDPEVVGSHEAFEAISKALGVSRSDVEAMDARLSGSDVSLNAQLVADDFYSASTCCCCVAPSSPWRRESSLRSLFKARFSIWRTRSLEMPRRSPNVSRVTDSSARRRSCTIRNSRSERIASASRNH